MEHISDAELLSMANSFEVLPFDPNRLRGVRMVKVERRSLASEPQSWAIISDGGFCLAHDGEWEYEPSPSSRDDDFLKRCRWSSAKEAIAFAKEHLSLYPDGDKTGPVTPGF